MSISQRFFNQIHTKHLIYTICWEDPAVDRSLLQLSHNSRILMITSAGCNALTYLLDNPKQIDTVDMNYRQNAVLALKIALIKQTDHSTFFSFFGSGFHPKAQEIYHLYLRDHLQHQSYVDFWDKHIKHFSKGSYFHSGSSGKLAAFLVKRLKSKGVYDDALKLLETHDKDEKHRLFNRVFYALFPSMWKRFVNSSLTMSFLGVPKAQKKLIDQEEGTIYRFIEKRLKHVFTALPTYDNYFYAYYLQGYVRPEQAPEYLKKEHFHTLQQRVERIQIHTDTLTAVAQKSTQQFSHFVLLDHQDWMASHQPEALDEEWHTLLNCSNEEARFLLRSASLNRDFLPIWLENHLRFDDEICKQLHPQDRVGTYASTHLAHKITEKVYV